MAVTHNLGSFAREMDAAAAAFERAVDVVVATGARGLLQSLTAVTPVDTGRAVSNWTVTLNAPASYGIPAYVPGAKANTERQNRSASLAAGLVAIRGFKSSTDRAIFVTNNVTYVWKLNAGSSRKAPAGFVEAAVMDALHAMERIDMRIELHRV